MIDGTIKIIGQTAAGTTVCVHHVHVSVMVAELLIIKAEVGNGFTIRRPGRRIVRAVAIGQLRQLAALHVDGPYFGFHRVFERIVDTVRGENDGAAVRGPGHRPIVVVVTAGQLSRRTTVRRYDKQM